MSDPPAPILAFHDVALVTGGMRLFDGLTFAIAPGERLAILGESGDGKSMIVRLAMGLALPMSGHVALFGGALDRLDQRAMRLRRARCGLVMQGGSLLSNLSVEDNLWLGIAAAAGARARLRRKLDRIMLEFEIEHVADTMVNALSAGERRRVELARAFLRDPELVILDEPFEGARGHGAAIAAQVGRQTRGRGRAMLLLTQDQELAERLCERVLRLDRGRLVQQPAGAALAVA